MLRQFLIGLCFLGGANSAIAVAPEAATLSKIEQGLKRLSSTATVTSIRPSALPGVSEVIVGDEVLYFSNDGKHLLQGRLISTESKIDLTADAESILRAKALQKIGPEKRLRFAAKNPKHNVTIFTDVDCGYCRKLHQEIANFNNAGISVDYLFFPRAGLNSASFDKAKFVWCAADQKQTMNLSMTAAGLAHRTMQCTNPIKETMELGQRIAKIGTPTIFAADGRMMGGYQSAAELTQRLNATRLNSKP